MELERFGKNLEKNIKRPNVIYISHALTSTICGTLLGLAGMLFEPDMYLLWILLGSIGALLGKKSLSILFVILNNNISILKNSLTSSDYLDDNDDNESKKQEK